MANNNMNKLRQFLAHKSREITMAEYTQFYKACSSEEKAVFMAAMDSWDGVSEFIPLGVTPVIEGAKPAVTVAA